MSTGPTNSGSLNNKLYFAAVQALKKSDSGLEAESSKPGYIDQRVSKLARRVFDSSIKKQATEAQLEKAKSLAEKLKVDPNSKSLLPILQAVLDLDVIAKDVKVFSIGSAKPLKLTAEPVPEASKTELTPVPKAPVNAPYTILTHCVDLESAPLLAVAFSKTAPRDLLPLQPSRVAMHEFLARLNLEYQMPAGKEQSDVFKDYSEAFMKGFEKANPGFNDKLNQERLKLESSFVKALESGDLEGLAPEQRQVVEAFQKQILVKDDHELSSQQINLAIAKRAANHIINSTVRALVDKLDVSNFVGPLKKTKTFKPEERKTFMINGGIASGKGSSEKFMKAKAASQGVKWQADVITLNTDSFKPSLLDSDDLSSEDQMFYSGLVHDEASLIRNRVFEKYKEMMTKQAPHIYVDMVWPAADIFELGASSPQGLDVMIVQIPVENSFKMAYSRGEKTGRFETRAGILSTHKYVPRQLHQSLKALKQQNLNNVRLSIYANLAPGKAEKIADFDFSKSEGIITDEQRFLEFYQKTCLNTQATTYEELYEGADLSSPENYTINPFDLASLLGNDIQVYNGSPESTLLATYSSLESRRVAVVA